MWYDGWWSWCDMMVDVIWCDRMMDDMICDGRWYHGWCDRMMYDMICDGRWNIVVEQYIACYSMLWSWK